MATKRDLLEILKFELDFLEHGGYGCSVQTPRKPTSAFQDSPTCINFDDPARTEPCTECVLMQFVPPERRGEDIPCHHIPLSGDGETIAALEAADNQADLEERLKTWLKNKIAELERELGPK